MCPHCGMKHKSKVLLKQHIRRMGKYHSKECVQCSYEFETWFEHQRHIETKHNGNWKYVCGLCPEVFDDERERKSHRKYEFLELDVWLSFNVLIVII